MLPDRPQRLPVQSDQLGVHRPRRLYPRRPDRTLTCSKSSAYPTGSTAPDLAGVLSRPSSPTRPRDGRGSVTAKSSADRGLTPTLLASHLRLQGSSTLHTRVPETTCPAMSRTPARTVSVDGSGPQTHGIRLWPKLCGWGVPDPDSANRRRSDPVSGPVRGRCGWTTLRVASCQAA